tara:strand:- start:555 stop:947 length:393 start_codon:yes stop_codon:yes gene_type:complete
MANNTITFDPQSGVAYGVNLTINTGSDFKSTFDVLKPDKSAYNLTGYFGSSQMSKSVAIGATGQVSATFSVGITSAAGGQFNISLGSTATRSLKEGRHVYDILVSSGSTIYRMVSGNVLVLSGISSVPTS